MAVEADFLFLSPASLILLLLFWLLFWLFSFFLLGSVISYSSFKISFNNHKNHPSFSRLLTQFPVVVVNSDVHYHLEDEDDGAQGTEDGGSC